MTNYMRKLGREGHLAISPLSRKQNKTQYTGDIFAYLRHLRQIGMELPGLSFVFVFG